MHEIEDSKSWFSTCAKGRVYGIPECNIRSWLVYHLLWEPISESKFQSAAPKIWFRQSNSADFFVLPIPTKMPTYKSEHRFLRSSAVSKKSFLPRVKSIFPRTACLLNHHLSPKLEIRHKSFSAIRPKQKGPRLWHHHPFHSMSSCRWPLCRKKIDKWFFGHKCAEGICVCVH